MAAVPGVKPLKDRECCQRDRERLAHILRRVEAEYKQRAGHHWQGHSDHSPHHQLVYEVPARLFKPASEEPTLLGLHRKRHVEEGVGNKVKPDNLRSQKRQRIADKERCKNSEHLSRTGRKEVKNHFLDCFIDAPSLFYSGNYRAEVVV